jgi:hypothetical protein
MLNSNAEYQKQLLLTRSEHILVLESALQESNAVHRKQWLKQQEEADELRKKLAEAQQMIDTLLKSSKYGSGRTERAAGGKIVIPVRGGVKRIMSGASHGDDNKERKTISSGKSHNSHKNNESDDDSPEGKSPTTSKKIPTVNSQTLPAKLIQRMPPSPIQSITNLLRRTNPSSTKESNNNSSGGTTTTTSNTLQPPNGEKNGPSSPPSSAFSPLGIKPKISSLMNAFNSKTQEPQPKPLTSPMASRAIGASPFSTSINSSNAPSPSPLKAFPVASATSTTLSSSTSHNRVGSKTPTPTGSRPATPPTGGGDDRRQSVSDFLENEGGDRSPPATDLTTLPPSL